VEDVNISDGTMFADEVEINFNMLDALMLDGIGGEVDRVDVATVDQSVDRRGTRFVVAHASAFKDIPSVLTLVQGKVIRTPLH
jgi:hypothetical protein